MSVIKKLFLIVFDFGLVSFNALLYGFLFYTFVEGLYTGVRCAAKTCNFITNNLILYIVYNSVMLAIVGWAFGYGLYKMYHHKNNARIFILFPFLWLITAIAVFILSNVILSLL